MLKKTGCKENDVVVLEIGNEAFTLAQMRKNGIMQFFDIVQPRNAWDGVDLNDVPSLFFIYVAEKNLDSLIVVKCLVPCDHFPRRSWPLFRAKAMLDDLIAGFSSPGIQSHQEELAA